VTEIGYVKYSDILLVMADYSAFRRGRSPPLNYETVFAVKYKQ